MPANWRHARRLASGHWHFPAISTGRSTRPLRKSLFAFALGGVAANVASLARHALKRDAGFVGAVSAEAAAPRLSSEGGLQTGREIKEVDRRGRQQCYESRSMTTKSR